VKFLFGSTRFFVFLFSNSCILKNLQAVLSETRSQQAASMTEFNWLGRRFPITNAKTRVSILKGI
jgi:signal recognition particle subunit SRP68